MRDHDLRVGGHTSLGLHHAGLTNGSVPTIILGHSITSLGVMRSLGRNGIPQCIASPGDSFVARSRWYNPCPGATPEYPKPTDLIEFLENLPFERAVLMPCSDDWVREVASLPPELQARFSASVATPAAIDALMDKGHLASVLERLGLPHPATTLIESPRDIGSLPDDAFADAFLKPRDSFSFWRQYGMKGIRVRDREDALKLVGGFMGDGHAFVLQEYVPTDGTGIYLIDGFVDRHGRLCASFARRRIRTFPPDFGVTSYATSIPLSNVDGAMRSLDRLFANVRYRGVFNMEFIRDSRDGVFRLLEVNVRPFLFIEFAAQCGIDLTLMAYRDALGNPVEPVVDYAVGRRSVDLSADLPLAFSLVRSHHMTFPSFLRGYIGARELTFAWDDPAPGIRRLRELAERELREALIP